MLRKMKVEKNQKCWAAVAVRVASFYRDVHIKGFERIITHNNSWLRNIRAALVDNSWRRHTVCLSYGASDSIFNEYEMRCAAVTTRIWLQSGRNQRLLFRFSAHQIIDERTQWPFGNGSIERIETAKWVADAPHKTIMGMRQKRIKFQVQR